MMQMINNQTTSTLDFSSTRTFSSDECSLKNHPDAAAMFEYAKHANTTQGLRVPVCSFLACDYRLTSSHEEM